MGRRVHKGGGSSPLVPPPGMSSLKSTVEYFLGALRHLFLNFTLVFPFYLSPHLFDKQQLYAPYMQLFSMSSRNPHKSRGEIT